MLLFNIEGDKLVCSLLFFLMDTIYVFYFTRGCAVLLLRFHQSAVLYILQCHESCVMPCLLHKDQELCCCLCHLKIYIYIHDEL